MIRCATALPRWFGFGGLWLAVLLGASPCSGAAAERDAPGPAAVTVPFRLVHGLVMVKGSLEGQTGLTWIVDTGASQTIITPACLASALPRRQAPLAWRMQTYTAQSLCAQDACVRRLPVAVFDPPQAAPLRLDHGTDYHGLLGYTFLCRFTATFDFPAGVLRLAPPPTPAAARSPAPRGAVAFQLVNHLVYVPVSINGAAPLAMIVDTGAAENLILPEAAARVGLRVQPPSLQGVSRGVAGECRVGNESQSGVPFVVHRLVREGLSRLDYDGILGTPFLSAFVLTLDYRRSTLTLSRPPPP